MMIFEDNHFRLEVVDFRELRLVDKQTQIEYKAYWGSGQPNSGSSLGMQTIMEAIKRFGIINLLNDSKRRLKWI